MHSVPAALAWEFWARHRWGLSAVLALVLGFALYGAIAPLSANAASLSSMWFVMGLCYVVGVFAYGFDGKLETAESGFPARLFLLPVRTPVLVGWPMLQGMATAVLLWLAWDRLVLRPAGIETAAWWTAMLAAVVAVSQAIAWLPFGLPWVRILVALTVLTALVRAPAILALAGERFADAETQNRILTALAVGLIPVAFLVAWAGVARARRGDGTDWLALGRATTRTGRPARERGPFRSALRAQVWYEWHVRGFGFAVTVTLVLVAVAALSVLVEYDAAARRNFAVVFLLIPVVLAPLWSSHMGTAGESVRSSRLSAFAATRPLGNVSFVAAKFRAAGLAALAAWAVVLVLLPVWLLYTGGYRELGQLWDAAVAKNGTARVIVLCVLLAVGPVLATWRMLAVGMWAGLTGRVWVGLGQTVVLMFVGLQIGHEWTMWNVDAARRERILDALPWVAGVAVAPKILLAVWALSALRRRGELSSAAVAKLLGLWCLVAASLFALLAWLAPPGLVTLSGLALGVVLFVPLARLAVAPLALAWNRHG
jgi:hypothetical protein